MLVKEIAHNRYPWEGIELVHLILLQEEEKMPVNFNITFLADSKIVVV